MHNNDTPHPFHPYNTQVDDPKDIPLTKFVEHTINGLAYPCGFSLACVPEAPCPDNFNPVRERPERDFIIRKGKAVLCMRPRLADSFINAADFRLATVGEKAATFRSLGELKPEHNTRAAFLAGVWAKQRCDENDYTIIGVERTAPVVVYGQLGPNAGYFSTKTAIAWQRCGPGLWLVGDFYDPDVTWMMSDHHFRLQFDKVMNADGGWWHIA